MTGAAHNPSRSVERFLEALKSRDLLYRLSWEDWLGVNAPYPDRPYERKPVVLRYNRNGYDWDIHGTVFTPEKEVDPSIAFVMCLGTQGSESDIDVTPDGRPGLIRILAAQGFKVLSLTYPGHFGGGPDGEWIGSLEERWPRYLDGPDLPQAEIDDRMLKCTFDTNVQGVGLLVDKYLAGRRLIVSNGPLAGRLPQFMSRSKLIGVAAYGFGGTNGWRKEWRETAKVDRNIHIYGIDEIERRDTEYHKSAGYEGTEDISPWGDASVFMDRIGRRRSQLKTSLNVNQHFGMPDILEPYIQRTGLPSGEYLDYLKSPDPQDLKSQSVLLLVGENDRRHWGDGATVDVKWEYFMAKKYAQFCPRVHLVPIPKHGHIGFAELHNEKAVYLWLWAFKDKYFNL